MISLGRIGAAVATALALAGLFATAAGAASLQPIGNFTEPMYVTSPPKEPNRLFVVERSGTIVQVMNGKVSPFADARPVVDCCSEDRGLQSIAVAPDFAKSGRFFLDYTDAAGNIQIAEMVASGRTAALSTLRALLTIPYEPDANHYGGQLQFDSAGNLYISTGDGGHGFGNDEHHNAQNLGALQGKILRIDPRPSGALPYGIPPGNPYAGAPAPFNAIWSSGLRNPYRFSLDPANGAIAIADVGENLREEVDYLPLAASGGANFGWNCREGGVPGAATDPQCATPPAAGYTAPIFEYGHKNPGGGAAWGCAIIGGFVVRDKSVADLYGRYLYADFCTAELRSFSPANPAGSDSSLNLPVGEVTSFGEDSCGRVYVAAKSSAVYRVTGSKVDSCLLSAKVAVKARKTRLAAGEKALITARVSPCQNRKGERIVLYRGAAKAGSKRLDGKCAARFRPRVSRPGTYRVKIAGDLSFKPATSAKLPLRLAPAR